MNDYDLGPKLSDSYTGTLEFALQQNPFGTALEFGVATGKTLALIAEVMPVIGFDSFEGLPEKWRDGFDKGMFACHPPSIPNATIVTGWFDESLSKLDWKMIGEIGLVHLDADLYSSTKTVLEYVGPLLNVGTLICFDEWHGYPGCEEHEQKAWKEFADHTGVSWEVLGHGPEQWLIRIVND